MMNADTYGASGWRPTALGLAGILLLAGLLSACNITGPEDERWLDVSSFSWPTDTQAVMHYKTVKASSPSPSSYTVNIRLADSTDRRNATLKDKLTRINRWNLADQIYMLDKANYSHKEYFIPLKDTLIALMSEVGATYALVAPLDTGHTWYCSYGDDNNPTQQARIVERYSYRKIEGKIYKNVIEVKYSSVGSVSDTSFWVCFYAQGIGLIQRLKYQIPIKSDNAPDTTPIVEEETVLTETNIQQK
ncbi:MAG: hypothetical protein JWQ98_2989 [Chlorobi bacterium]|jgi:hypothetical protein|nr:hypothetical protein [Chlorobiota bacterium]